MGLGSLSVEVPELQKGGNREEGINIKNFKGKFDRARMLSTEEG